MAIVIEEERTKVSSIVDLLTWLVIVILVGAVVYYVFFKRPELIEIAPPSTFKNTQELSKINLNADDITQNAIFQSLKQYVTVPKAQTTGRSTPFLGL